MAVYTPKYPYAELGSTFDLEWLATLNRNFDDVETDIRRLLVYTDLSLKEIRDDIAAWKADMIKQFNDFKTSVNASLDAFRKEMDAYKAYIDEKVASIEDATKFMVWKEPVANFAALRTTYPNPARGWTVQTLDDNKVYSWSGTEWVWALQYDVGNFSPYVFIEPAELKAQIQAIANRAV